MNSKMSSFLKKISCHKTLNNLHIKLLLPTLLLLFLSLLLLLHPSPPPSPPTLTSFTAAASPSPDCHPIQIPSTLADTIIHYATSNTTPQQTFPEISVTAKVLRRRSPCRFLVFGLGLDSPMWAALNHGGRTVFLEEDQSWIATVRARFPSLEAYHVRYDTRVSDADRLMAIGRSPDCMPPAAAGCGLALKGLPEVFYEEEWDLIMVDAPTGWVPEAPGRMGAIYTAGMAARGRRKEGETDVFVHDVDRKVEDEFSKEFLCEGYLREQVGRLRHFSVPSHLNKEMMPFCPSLSL